MKKLIPLIICILIFACSPKKSSDQQQNQDTTVNVSGSLAGMLVADTIVYDVIIRNTNPEDLWTEECLAGLKRSELVDSIFSLLYEERLQALNFDTQEALKIKDIKDLEKQKDFSRDKIGKIQFTEKWVFDTQNSRFTKSVISMVFGYEVYDDSGELRGYKPAFLIKLNSLP